MVDMKEVNKRQKKNRNGQREKGDITVVKKNKNDSPESGSNTRPGDNLRSAISRSTTGTILVFV